MNQWTKNPVDIRLRFFSKIWPISDDNGCWIWIGNGQKNRYGLITFNGCSQLAHRVSWQIHFGEIPKGLEVCHECDVSRCVNPFHLFLGTHRENMKDMADKGRSSKIRGESHIMSKINEDIVRLIRTSNESDGKLSQRHNISRRQIFRIKHKLSWKHVDG